MNTESQEVEETISEEISPEEVQVEKEALSMGWIPEDQFTGDKSKFVSAREFVEKGKHVIPILTANNRRLQEQLLQRDRKLDTLSRQVENHKKAMEALEGFYSESVKRQVSEAKAKLRQEIANARSEDDVEAELTLQEELNELTLAERESVRATKKKADSPEGPSREEIEAQALEDLETWKESHEWFEQDIPRTQAIVKIAENLVQSGVKLTGLAFYNEAYRRLLLEEKKNPGPPPSKVGGGKHSGTGASSVGSFNSLPPEAKAACHKDIDLFVGPGKICKTQKDWEARYAKIYYGDKV